jgi:hypothetical protein
MASRKKTLLSVGIFMVLATAVVLWLMSREGRYMTAEVNSTNGSHYGMLIPSTMEPAGFDENASFQYEDKQRELYALVIDESKAKIISFDLDYDLETYMKIASHILDSAGMYVNKPLTINGNKALQTDIKKKLNNQSVIYRLTVVETPKYYYQLLAWTTDSRYESNKDDMDKIISSFREIESAAKDSLAATGK